MTNEIEFVESSVPVKVYKVLVNSREVGRAYQWNDRWFVAEIDGAPNWNTYLHANSLEELGVQVDDWREGK